MKIISRAGWGARKPKHITRIGPSKREYFVVHHSGAPSDQSVRAIQDWCMDGRGFSDIDYNHLVRGSTGEIYEGRGWDVVGAHTTGYNSAGYGVCVIGDDELSDAAKRSVIWLYQQATTRSGPLKARGHRDLDATGCPGDRIYAWVKAGMPSPQEEKHVDLTDTQIDQIADRTADKVWSRAFGTDSTEARWPGAGKKNAQSFLMLAAMGAKDATRGIVALAAKDQLDENALAASLVPLLSSDQLEVVIRKGMTTDERHALAARLAS